MKKEYKLPIMRCEVLCPDMNMMLKASNDMDETGPEGQGMGW